MNVPESQKPINGREWYILSSGSLAGIHSRFPFQNLVPLPLAEFTYKFLSQWGWGGDCTFCFQWGADRQDKQIPLNGVHLGMGLRRKTGAKLRVYFSKGWSL